MRYLQDKGFALIMAIAFLAVLMMLGAYLATQSLTGLQISSGLRDYEKCFNIADGACQISMEYVKNYAPDAPAWDPSLRGKITSNLPSYMDGTTLSDGERYTPEVWWEGYDTKPLPGWMLNWQGYSAFHRVNYKCRGVGSIPSRQSETKVYGLVMYMKR